MESKESTQDSIRQQTLDFITGVKVVALAALAIILTYLFLLATGAFGKGLLLVICAFYLLSNAYWRLQAKETNDVVSTTIKTLLLAGCLVIIIKSLGWI